MTSPAVADEQRPQPPAPPARDVVFTFSFVTWDGASERGMNFAQDRLLQRLMQDASVRRLVVANPYRAAARRAARRLLRRERPFAGGDRATMFNPVRLRRSDPVSIARLERSYAAYDRALRRFAERSGLERPAVITANPLIAGFAPLEWAGPVTFYATDDWTAHWAYEPLWPAFEEAYARVQASGHRLCAVSQQIVDRVAPRERAVVIPNGVEPEEWRSPGRAPAWLAALPSPRLLYIGNVDSRIDVEQVLATARRFPHGSVILIGPVPEPSHVSALGGVANVHLHRRLPRAEVPAAIKGADACLLPHRRTALTEAMSPLKLYEYLAAGRPVASVDLPPIRLVDDPHVVLSSGHDPRHFADAVARAVEIGPMAEHHRQAFVRANAWEHRHEQLIEFALG